MKHIDSLRKYYEKLVVGQYSIGFYEGNLFNDAENFNFSDIHWINMKDYKHGWFADPFILEVTPNEVILLVEEFEYCNSKGRICKIHVDKESYNLIEVTPLLSLDTHLSFPSIHRIDNKIYVCPENGEAGSVKIYELVDEKLINPVILIDEPLVDTQILHLNDKYYAMGVIYDLSSQNTTKVLKIYESDKFLGPYHYLHSIINDSCGERGAGNIFCDNGKIIRPAQDCENGYGRGIILYDLNFTEGLFFENEISRIYGSYWKRWALGIHQIHTHKNMTVVDGRDYKYHFVGFSKRVCKKLFNIGTL